MNHLPACITFFLLLMLFLSGLAQPSPFWEHYSPPSKLELQFDGETGFNFFFQDSRGFLWGSDKKNYKLVRFDGKQMVYIPSDAGDATTHSGCDYWSNGVQFLEDKEGHIWMLSMKGCVDRYDPVSGQFERIHDQARQLAWDSLQISNPGSFNLFEDSHNNIWIASGVGVFKYTLENKTLDFYYLRGIATLVFEDTSQNIWVKAETNQSDTWLTRLDEKNRQFVDRIDLHLPIKAPRFNRRDEYGIIKGSDSILMLTDFNLVFFDPIKRAVDYLQDAPFDEQQFARGMHVEEDLILVNTIGPAALFQFDPETGTFLKHPTLDSVIETDENSGLSEVFRTRDGVIRMSQGSASIQILPPKTNFSSVDFPADLLPGSRRDLRQADPCLMFNGTVYFHTINGLIPARDTTVPVPTLNVTIEGVQNPMNLIYNFENDQEGHLWVAASSIDQGKRMVHIRKFDNNGYLNYSYNGPYSLEGCQWPGRAIRHLKIDKKGGLWIGTGRHLSYFDPGSSSFKQHLCASREGKFKEVFVRCMYVDRDDDLWVGTTKSGLMHFDGGLEEWEFVSLDGKKERETITIYSIFQDSEGIFWVGTPTGLVKFDKETGVIRKYDQSDRLQALLAEKIFEDHHQNLWVTTGNWVARYDPVNDHFIPFTRADGLIELDYANSDVIKDESNYIFLPAGLFQLGYFHPDSMQIDSMVPEIYFTEFQLFQERIKPGGPSGILPKTLDHTERIVLDYAQNDFTIHYSAPNFIHPHKTIYAVQLEGFHKDWQEVGTRQEAQFTNLSSGTYVFKVKVRNHHGFGSKTPRSLIISVLPPWYRNWWAYTLWGLLFLLLVYSIYQYQLQRQLAIAEAQRLKELDQIKSELYTNITHEFRTPLTIILGMANQMKNDPKNWFNEGLRLIRRNGKQLLNLVNQLLDLSKLESGNTTLNWINGDIVSYLHYLTESFHSFADSKDIRLHFLPEVDEFQMDYDPEKMQNVVSNLLSNAIKFTPAGGDVYLIIRSNTLGVFKTPRVLDLIIKDSGLGIPPEHLPYIFDRFYQVDATATRRGEGTGIGLALTKELVKLMGGSIEVESKINKGTTFSILLPVTQEAKSSEHTLPRVEVSPVSGTILLESESEFSSAEASVENQPLILLIEDNADVVIYLSSILSGDYQMETARDGQQGINKAIELIPDLIVSDVMMPKKDGFEVCATLKEDERTSHIPIILLTAKSDATAKLEGLTHGADAYLAKPFNKEELLIRMEKLIVLRKRLRVHYQNTSHLLRLPTKPTPTIEDRFLQRLINIVEENLENEHFGLSDLCRKAHLSRSQVFRKLKALTGQSTTHFIRNIRLEKGKILLETTDSTVAEVAFKIGFSSANYFSRIFKEEFGIPPSEVGKR